MTTPTVTLVTDSNCNFQAIYYDGKLVADIGDQSTTEFDSISDALEMLCEKLDVPFETLPAWQPARKIQGFDWTEYEGYWPDNLSDVPPDETNYGPENDEQLPTDGNSTDPTW